LGYWFYAKIGFPDPEGSGKEKYLLASDIEVFEHTYQPAYSKHGPGFKPCLEAFMTACPICGVRDVVEEFLAAKVWPLSAGWSPLRFERKRFAGLKYDATSPVFGIRRPEGASDEVIVAELERQAAEILGP